MSSKKLLKEERKTQKRVSEKLTSLRTLIAIIAGTRDILHLHAESTSTSRPPLRTPTAPLKSVLHQSEGTKEVLSALQSCSTLLVRHREIMATGSTLPEDNWHGSSVQTDAVTFYVTGNPRKLKDLSADDALVHTGDPVLIHMDESEIAIDLANPFPFLIENWGKISSQLHAAILVKYLNHKVDPQTALHHNNNPRLNLFAYVSAQCSLKMRARFIHPVNSMQFHRSLTQASMLATHRQGVFPTSQPVHGPDGQGNAAFLKAILHPWNNQFLRLSSIAIQQLLSLAEQFESSIPSSAFPLIYTRQTCQEFQTLLCHVLKAYSKAMEDLHDFKSRPDAKDTLRYEQCVHALTAAGLTLQTIVNTSFFPDHLSRLRLIYMPPATVVGIDNNEDDNDNDNDDNPDHHDHDNQPDTRSLAVRLQSAPPNQKRAILSTAILNWVKRLVIPYQAASHLLQSPISGNGQLSLCFVATSSPGNTLLRWETCISRALAQAGSTPEHTADAINALRHVFHEGLGEAATQHCEATLAAMIADGKLPGATPIIGVSKRSCPICYCLLSMLPPGFDITAWHKTVSGCSIPPSIPENVLDKMWEHFSMQALDDTHRLLDIPNLAALCLRPYEEKRRLRTDSTQTQPLSATDTGGAAVAAFIDYVACPGPV